MTTSAAYRQLQIPHNLQKHMLRVASLLKLMSDNWQGPRLDRSSLILAGLFHDNANIIKFDFSRPQMMGKEADRVEHWRQVQRQVTEKYGVNIHQATIKMCHELKLSFRAIRIIESLEWNRVSTVLKNKDWEVGLAIYADMRIDPSGIIPLKDRIDNLNARRPMTNYRQVLSTAQTLESHLQNHITIPLQAITNPQLNRQFPLLRKLEF